MKNRINILSLAFIIIILLPIVSVTPEEKPAYLSELEYQVLQEMNLARTNPEKYVQILKERKKLYNGKLYKLPGASYSMRTNEGVSAVNEAIRVLSRQKPMDSFKPSEGMSKAARDHVKDTGPKGILGHVGADKSTMSQRIERHGEWQGSIGENISYGLSEGREVVLQLIIDDGVKSRGHRKNIYTSRFRIAGIACGFHKVYRYMCVIDYAEGFTE